MYNIYDNIKNYDNSNWIDFYILIGKFSKSLREKDKDKDKIEKLLINTLFHILCFSKQNNIDIVSSWTRWKVKVDYKNYY